jgi:hypothetical protein
VRAPGFEPWWVASHHWTVLPLDYRCNRHRKSFGAEATKKKDELMADGRRGLGRN